MQPKHVLPSQWEPDALALSEKPDLLLYLMESVFEIKPSSFLHKKIIFKKLTLGHLWLMD